MSPRMSSIAQRIVGVKRQRRRVSKRLMVGLSILCALALAGTLTPGPASADTSSSSSVVISVYTGIIRNWATGACLDAFANVNPCYGNDNYQEWAVAPGGRGSWESPTTNGSVYIENMQTGACLDDGSGLYMNSSCVPNDPAQQWFSLGTPYQAWFINSLTGQCLDNNGSSLYTLPCNGGGYQTWRWDGSM